MASEVKGRNSSKRVFHHDLLLVGQPAGEGARATWTLVETNQEDGSFGSCGLGGELLGTVVIVVKNANANPPVSGRAGEA